MTYEWLTNINSLNFEDKTVLIIGAGSMAEQYALALSKMNIDNVTILSRGEEKTNNLCQRFGYKPLSGGFEKHLDSLETADLVIVTPSIHMLVPAAKQAKASGQTNILIEKPVSLYHQEILSLAEELGGIRVRVGYNRLVYPNFYLLKEIIEKEGGITSCRFTFTEWPHRFDFTKHRSDAYRRWGVVNCLHPISMAHELIGMPKQINTYQTGKLDWHPSGSAFVGSGITEMDIPFSYHANWNSAGRWGVEVMTDKNAYRLMPLEELYVCKKGSIKWEKVPFRVAYPNTKPGIAEEVAVMLQARDEQELDLMSLEKAISYTKLAEKIFAYDSSS